MLAAVVILEGKYEPLLRSYTGSCENPISSRGELDEEGVRVSALFATALVIYVNYIWDCSDKAASYSSSWARGDYVVLK